GRIQVVLRADGADAVLSVEDSGFGIAPSLLPFIFEMYVQADETLGRARTGLGIGLPPRRPPAGLRGGPAAAPRGGRPRTRLGPRQPPRRVARGDGGRFERRRRTRQPVPGAAQQDSFGRHF